jgi:hypothetical protein
MMVIMNHLIVNGQLILNKIEIVEIVKILCKGENVMKRVILESPYAGNFKLNEMYGEFCMHDCIVNHNEAPYASHLLYTRDNVLRDTIPEERKLGIEAGFFWRECAEMTVFYIDLGMTEGMEQGIKDCMKKGLPYEVRGLSDDVWERFEEEKNKRFPNEE